MEGGEGEREQRVPGGCGIQAMIQCASNGRASTAHGTGSGNFMLLGDG